MNQLPILLRILITLLVLFGLALFFETAYNQNDANNQPLGLQMSTTTHDGASRIYGVYQPASLKPANAPLIFLLHGGGGGAEQIFNTDYGQSWKTLADEHGFLLVVPQGRQDPSAPDDHHWNDCRRALANPDVDSQLDDVGFITSLIDLMASRFNIDEARVYATGASNGGMMSYRLAFEAPERFAAIGAVIANLPDPSECNAPELPISMLIMNGTADPLMPYNGGCVANNSCNRGTVTSTADTLNFWIEHNGTQTTPEIKNFPDINTRDSSKVSRYSYSGGTNGTEVVLYRVDGGGHTVPGPEAQSNAQSIAVGPKNRDIDGAKETWEFFERQSR